MEFFGKRKKLMTAGSKRIKDLDVSYRNCVWKKILSGKSINKKAI